MGNATTFGAESFISRTGSHERFQRVRELACIAGIHGFENRLCRHDPVLLHFLIVVASAISVVLAHVGAVLFVGRIHASDNVVQKIWLCHYAASCSISTTTLQTPCASAAAPAVLNVVSTKLPLTLRLSVVIFVSQPPWPAVAKPTTPSQILAIRQGEPGRHATPFSRYWNV